MNGCSLTLCVVEVLARPRSRVQAAISLCGPIPGSQCESSARRRPMAPDQEGINTPTKFSCGSEQYAWWQCDRYHSHIWRARINSRTGVVASGPSSMRCYDRQGRPQDARGLRPDPRTRSRYRADIKWREPGRPIWTIAGSISTAVSAAIRAASLSGPHPQAMCCTRGSVFDSSQRQGPRGPNMPIGFQTCA